MYYVNPNVRDLYRVKCHDIRDGILRLDMNENPGGLPRDFVEEVKARITPEFLATYPVKDRLAELLAQHNGVSVGNITITSGSDEAIRLIFQCFGEPGKQVLTVTPTFEMYDVYAQMFGMEHVTAEYRPDFSLSLENMLSQISRKTGMVVLLNPNSPIGACWSEKDVRTVIERAAEAGAVVVVDEAYHYFCSGTFMPLVQEYGHLLVLRTFSKLFSCAGLRIGYAAGSEQMIRYIENAEATFNVNRVAVLFAEELMLRPDVVEEMVKTEREGRRWLTAQLAAAGYRLLSLEGNYVLFQPHQPSGEVVAKLRERGIWVRDYSRGILAGWVRVSTGGREFMERFWGEFSQIDAKEDGIWQL